MAATDPTSDPSSSAASPADTGAGAASYTIEISVTPDGISVGVESADQESAESGGAGDAGGAEATPVPSIKAALTLALDIYRNDGEMPESSNGDEDMASGFGGGAGAASGSAGAASGTGGM